MVRDCPRGASQTYGQTAPAWWTGPTTGGPTQQPYGTAAWPSGKPKIWCPYHGREVAHRPEECILRHGGKGAAQGRPYTAPIPMTPQRQPPSTHTAGMTFEEQIRKVVAEALPQYAEQISRETVQWGVRIVFERKATETDAKAVREAAPYIKGHTLMGEAIILEVRSAEEKELLMKLLDGAMDNDRPIQVTEWGKQGGGENKPAATPLRFGEPRVKLRPEAPMETDDGQGQSSGAGSTQPSQNLFEAQDNTRMRAVEADIAVLQGHVSRLDHKIDALGDKIDAGLRPPPILAANRPPRMTAPDVATGRTVWMVLRRKPFDEWMAYTVQVLASDGKAFRGMASTPEGTPLPDMCPESDVSCAFEREADARDTMADLIRPRK